MSSWIVAAGPWLMRSLVVSFLLGRNLKYVLLVLRGSNLCDSILHVSCTRPGLTTVSLSEGHVERMDRHIIPVFNWEDRMEDWVIIWHPIIFENDKGNSR